MLREDDFQGFNCFPCVAVMASGAFEQIIQIIRTVLVQLFELVHCDFDVLLDKFHCCFIR